MLWLVALFIILQPGIFSTKKTFVKVEDILLRALVFGIVMYFLGGPKEGFQISNNVVVNPTASQQAALDANAAAEPQPYNVISTAPTGPPVSQGPPPPPPGYVQAAFFGQNDINAGFDNIDTYLSQLSYGIKGLFNRSSGSTGPPPP